MDNFQKDIDDRANLTLSNRFELLLFRLGTSLDAAKSELFGINVFKLREIVPMPTFTRPAGMKPPLLGMVNIRDQVIPVIDLAAVAGCKPATGLNILLITEYARSVQAFAVESVENIIRTGLETGSHRRESDQRSLYHQYCLHRMKIRIPTTLRWCWMLSRSCMTSCLRIMTYTAITCRIKNSILNRVLWLSWRKTPKWRARHAGKKASTRCKFRALCISPVKMPREKIQIMAQQAESEGVPVSDKISMVLTDLEMPEMDGFTLTRLIKTDPRLKNIPVVIHSSLSGSANEDHVRKVQADGYVAKFEINELSAVIQEVLDRAANNIRGPLISHHQIASTPLLAK